jgi:hypothetical protein
MNWKKEDRIRMFPKQARASPVFMEQTNIAQNAVSASASRVE